MSRNLKSLMFPLFALLLVALPAFSQVTGVEGVIKDENGKLLKDAVVNFHRTDIKGEYHVNSDKKGHYGHYGLPIGKFDVTVVVDGKVRDTYKGVQTHPGDPLVHDFDLKQNVQEQQSLAKAVETGTLTKEQDRSMSKEEKAQFEAAVKAKEKQQADRKALNDSFSTGKTALDAKQWDVAIENLSKSAELDAKQGAVWSALADAYVGKAQATPAEAAADYDKAFDAFKKAVEITPEDAGLYNNYALALAKDKKLDEAKANLAKAAQLDPPGAGKYYYNLGALLVNGGQNGAAEEEFRKATEADPNYADAQFQLGMALAAKANADPKTGKITAVPGTVEALNKYLELKPDGASAQSAKEMIAALGGSVSTSYGTQKSTKAAPANTKKK